MPFILKQHHLNGDTNNQHSNSSFGDIESLTRCRSFRRLKMQIFFLIGPYNDIFLVFVSLGYKHVHLN